jgi:hypothetical protein
VTCLEENCMDSLSDCHADSDCECVLSCVLEGEDQGICVQSCGLEDPPGRYHSLLFCISNNCDELCW